MSGGYRAKVRFSTPPRFSKPETHFIWTGAHGRIFHVNYVRVAEPDWNRIVLWRLSQTSPQAKSDFWPEASIVLSMLSSLLVAAMGPESGAF
jgi:hypothetical protein